jgi:glucose/arabinose dehydrogenase
VTSVRRPPTALAAIAAAALALLAAGCGEKEEPEVVGPPAVEPAAPAPAPGGQPTGDGVGGVRLERVGEFDSPVHLAQAQGERALYVVEQTGRIIRVDAQGRRSTFLDISGKVSCCGEQGLLSVALAPDYRRSGRFYVDYTDRAGDTHVVEYRRSRRDETRADPRTARELLRVDQPYANHNGGLILFGPDGHLYVGLGDGGSAGDPDRTAQDLGSPLGKILRIDPRPSGGEEYSIPAANPFAEREGARPEIFLYGLRNPWRFSFDPATGGLWIGDVGQDAQEEIDYVPPRSAGANLGWSAYEGTERFNSDQRAPNALAPVLTYGRDRGCSVTGGMVARDRDLESLYGRYLYADFCEGQIRSFAAADAIPGPVGDDRPLGLQVPAPASFAEDANGNVYVVSLEGAVYRLEPDKS